MKWLKLFICGILGIIITVACDINQSSDIAEQDTNNLGVEEKTKYFGNSSRINEHLGKKYRVIPFEGDFFSTNPGIGVAPNERCSAPAVLQTQSGEGKAKHLGTFSFHSTFCIDLSDIASDGVLNENDALPFYGEIATFTFANGDELHASGGSAVMPTDNPDYDGEFSNNFAIVGGTGRFEGAQGGGSTYSLVSFLNGTDHELSGVIVIPKHRENRH